MERKYWTKEELVEYFKKLAYEFQRDGGRYHNDYYLGKADAYETGHIPGAISADISAATAATATTPITIQIQLKDLGSVRL